jgi:molybdopterin molybdotransferase
MKTAISFDDAKRIIESNIPQLPAETVDLGKSLGRILATDVICPEDVPPFDRTSMDGYAVRIEGAAQQVVPTLERKVIGDIQAGSIFRSTLDKGTAVRIMTGAAIPAGANAVVELFRTQSSGAMSSLSGSNCLIVLPEDGREFQKGDSVDVLTL